MAQQDSKSRLDAAAAAAARERRRRKRESEIPETFTCAGCNKPIEGTVVFWWNGNWGRGRAHDVTWCEPCWTVERIKENSERFKPDPHFDPWHVGQFEPKPCGHCGRSIRWGNPDGFCCDRCHYEATKAARRVGPTETWCAACGEMFTPKRSDAKTCSDRCRQALRRKTQDRVTAKRVASARPRPRDTARRDATGGK